MAFQITNEMIHPELRRIGMLMRFILPHFRHSTFINSNRLLNMMKGKSAKGIEYKQVYLPRPDRETGMEDLRCCVYSPLVKKGDSAGVLWLHGGGYALGNPEMDERFIRDFVQEFGCTVVAPDYRLSTEAPYPAALEDCYTTLFWLAEHTSDLGVRADQLMVGGESAGGGLAAALTIVARDKGEVAIAFQMPLYPMLDDRMITNSSQNNDAPVWNTKSSEISWRLYLGDLYGKDQVPAYAAPARLKDFQDLPPAFTFVGSIDPFHDETLTYMQQLRAAGVPVKFRVFDGCFHGFDVIANKSTPAQEAKALLMENIAYALSHYFAEQPDDLTKTRAD